MSLSIGLLDLVVYVCMQAYHPVREVCGGVLQACVFYKLVILA